MFRKLVILAVAAIACVSAVDTKVETELLQKLVRYEAEKAAALTELAEIQKIVASMTTKVEVSALATGSSSGASEATVGSSSGGDEYEIGTVPPITTAPTSAPETESGSAANSSTVTNAPAATTAKPASAATVNHVAPVAVAVVAAAIAML